MRTVYEAESSLYESPAEDEQFTEGAVIDLIKDLMVSRSDEVVATVSAEWERKDAKVRGRLDDPHSYRHRPATDDLVLTLELRIDGYSRAAIGVVGALESEVREITAQRAEARAQAELARLEAEVAVQEAALAEQRAKLAALRADKA